MNGTMKKVRKVKDRGEATQCGNAELKRKQRLEREREHLVRNRVPLSPQQLSRAIESTEMGSSVGNLYVRMLAELFEEEALRFFANCARKWVSLDRSHVRDEMLGQFM